MSETILPLEVDLQACVTEQELPTNIEVENVAVTPEPALLAASPSSEETQAETVTEPTEGGDLPNEFSLPETTSVEMEATAEPAPVLSVETTTFDKSSMQSAALAKPQVSIPQFFGPQRSSFFQVLVRGWSWLQHRLRTQQARKRLRVCESVSLGEKRFIAVVQVDGEQFLVGGSSTSVSTLAHLEQPREFSEVFRRFGQTGMQA
jgi:hypothetical protein